MTLSPAVPSIIFFNTTQLISPSTATYFVTFDFNSAAVVGTTDGLIIQSTSYVSVEVPNLVSPANFPMPVPNAPATIAKQVATVQVSTTSLAPRRAWIPARTIWLC